MKPFHFHAGSFLTLIISLVLIPIFTAVSFDVTALDTSYDAYLLKVSKSEQELKVMKGDQIVSRYRIAYGKGGDGTKRKLGDNKTPVGTYKVMDFKDDSKFHYFMQINYPNLLDAWYGYKDHIINAHEFREIATAFKHKQKPPQDTGLGGFIGIHGLGEVTEQKLKIHDTVNWTEGCIALKNEEVNELRKYVSIGTRIIISE